MKVKIWVSKNAVSVTGSLICLAWLTCAVVGAQAQQIEVIAPVANSKVVAGQPVIVSVTAQAGRYDQILLVGPQIGVSTPLNAPPYNFVVSFGGGYIGISQITAMGTSKSGAVAFSNPVSVDVEPATTPVSLSFANPDVSFTFVGDSTSVSVYGTFPDGKTSDITTSPALVASITPANVATYDPSIRSLVAIGPGTATLSVSYGTLTASVPIYVPSAAAGDLDANGRVDIDDLRILLSALGDSASSSTDARDLDHDGLIDMGDVRALIALCTSPNCGYSADLAKFIQNAKKYLVHTPESDASDREDLGERRDAKER
jgi:hypothetical protein